MGKKEKGCIFFNLPPKRIEEKEKRKGKGGKGKQTRKKEKK